MTSTAVTPSRIYLDHAATAPLRPEAKAAWLEAISLTGNASSTHAEGRSVRSRIETARQTILKCLGAIGHDLIFTSGATEANGLAVNQGRKFSACLYSAGEHDSLLAPCRALAEAIEIPLNPGGEINMDVALEIISKAAQPVFVAALRVNNETGVISDLQRLSEAVSAQGGWLHIDAVQAPGRSQVDFNSMGATSMSVSAHKMGGPQGVGALIIRRGARIDPLITGGGQEQGARPGTENAAGICAFAAACEQLSPETWGPRIMAAQARVEARLTSLGAIIMGAGAERAPGIISVAQPYWPAQLQLIEMDMAGFSVSSGSACSSGKVKASRVVTAMGRTDLADKSLRISLGWNSREEELDRFYDVWAKAYLSYLKRNQLPLPQNEAA